jgi:hypothetical protein
MPRSYEFVLERSGPGNAEAAFDLIRDADSWVGWAGAPISYSAWREGDSEGSVVGQVRLVGKRQFPMAEEVTIDDRPHTHGYRIAARWPVRDYSARVDFIQKGDELTIRWSGQFGAHSWHGSVVAGIPTALSGKSCREID